MVQTRGGLFVGSLCWYLGSFSGTFPPFGVRGMTCRDDDVDALLKSIVNRDGNELVQNV